MILGEVRENVFKLLCRKLYGIEIIEYSLRNEVEAVDDLPKFFEYFADLRARYPRSDAKRVLLVGLRSYSVGGRSTFDELQLKAHVFQMRAAALLSRVLNLVWRR